MFWYNQFEPSENELKQFENARRAFIDQYGGRVNEIQITGEAATGVFRHFDGDIGITRYSWIDPWVIFVNGIDSNGVLKEYRHLLSNLDDPHCYHDWNSYVGFTHTFEYCKKCDKKKD